MFEETFLDAVKQVRNRLTQYETAGNEFSLSCKADGRIHDGETRITYSLGANIYETPVTGDSVDAVVAEYVRRKGWNKQHQYVALSA